MVALVKIERELLVDGRGIARIHRVGSVLLQHPAETGDRIAVSIHHVQVELRGLDRGCGHQGEQHQRVTDPCPQSFR